MIEITMMLPSHVWLLKSGDFQQISQVIRESHRQLDMWRENPDRYFFSRGYEVDIEM